MDENELTSEMPEVASEELREILKRLSPLQIRFLVARMDTMTDKEAAQAIGIKPQTVGQWKYRDGAPINEALRLMAQDGVVVALHIRRRALAKAMLEKVRGLESKKEHLRQKAATEIIEWELGKAGQPIDMTSGGKPLFDAVAWERKARAALEAVAEMDEPECADPND